MAGQSCCISTLHIALDATWSFRAGITPGQTSSNKPGAAFWRQSFAYDPEQHGTGPFKLALPGMGKGQIWLNGQNAGRYWQIGPQEFYKLPVSWLQAENELLLLDEQGCEPDGGASARSLSGSDDGDPVMPVNPVMPADAGIHPACLRKRPPRWVPASAGMTKTKAAGVTETRAGICAAPTLRR